MDEIFDELRKSLKDLHRIYTVAIYPPEKEFIPTLTYLEALVVFNYDFIIPKKSYVETIRWYSKINPKIKKKFGVEIIISPYDMGNLELGKFCFMPERFKESVRKNAITIYGKDIKGILPSNSPKGEELYVAHDLLMTRRNFITSDYETNPQKFGKMYKFMKDYLFSECIKGLKNFVKKVCIVKDGYLKGKSDEEILEQFYSLFPEMSDGKIEELMSLSFESVLRKGKDYFKNLLYLSLNLREKIVLLCSKS
jgi:hypothetical protein